MNSKLREVPAEQIGRAMMKVIALVQLTGGQAALGFQQSCIACWKFDEAKELCKPYGLRPPARIIAFGCNEFDDSDDIPF